MVAYSHEAEDSQINTNYVQDAQTRCVIDRELITAVVTAQRVLNFMNEQGRGAYTGPIRKKQWTGF